MRNTFLCLSIVAAIAVSVPAADLEPLFTNSPLASAVANTMALRGLHADPEAGNQVAILDNGYDALLFRLHLIRNARHSISIQTFIWTDDECGRLMIWELIRAARRGVKVRILADHIASDQDPDTVAFLATIPNLEVRHYRPAAQRIRPSKFRVALASLFGMRDTNQRMHNKVMLFDDAVLITGGRNIENTYFNHSIEMNFRDRDVLAIGPIAAEAAESFEEFWKYRHSVPSRKLVDVAATLQQNTFVRRDQREDFDFGPFFKNLDRQADDPREIESRLVGRLHPAKRVRFLADEPGKNRSWSLKGQGRITRQLTDILWEAQDSLVIQSPYLILSSKASELFRKMKARSPKLRIVISSNSFGSTDNLLAYSANYRLRASYVENLGLEIHEYKPHPAELLMIFSQYPLLEQLAVRRNAEGLQQHLPFLCIHAKSCVVDDRVAFIGSFNLDPRSENLNTEAGLVIEDEVIAAELKKAILTDASGPNSWVIATRQVPLQLDKVNRLVDGVLGLSPIDLWPLQNTTSFEWILGQPEVPPDHPDFYKSYKEAGDFPGADGTLSGKEIFTRIYKAVGSAITPML